MNRRRARPVLWYSLLAVILFGVAVDSGCRRHQAFGQPLADPLAPETPFPGSPAADESPTPEPEDPLAKSRGPLDFWGRVYDEISARPVEGAQVILRAMDGTRSGHDIEFLATSDREGRFQWRGQEGTSLNVSVTKSGYYTLPHRSDAFFEFGRRSIDPVMNWRPFPTGAEEPVTFFLRRHGTPAALLVVENARGGVPRDGSPVTVNLTTGKKVPAGSGELTLQTWVNNEGIQPGEHYDWRCVIAVPGGGLVLRRDAFDFEASESGYAPGEDIFFARTLDRQAWTNYLSREYFFKTADGSTAA